MAKKKEIGLADVVYYLRVSNVTIRRLERSGAIPKARRKGKNRVYNEEEFFQLYYYFYKRLIDECKDGCKKDNELPSNGVT